MIENFEERYYDEFNAAKYFPNENCSCRFLGTISSSKESTDYYYVDSIGPYKVELDKEENIINHESISIGNLISVIKRISPDYWPLNFWNRNMNAPKKALNDLFKQNKIKRKSSFYQEHSILIDSDVITVLKIFFSLLDEGLIINGNCISEFVRISELEQNWVDNNKNNLFLQRSIHYFINISKAEAEYGYTDILFKLTNYPISLLELIDFEVPLIQGISDKFTGIPILLQISNRRYYFDEMDIKDGQDTLVQYFIPFIRQLERNHIYFWALTTANEILSIKNDNTLSLDEKFEILHQKALNEADETEVRKIKIKNRLIFSEYYDLLSSNGLLFFNTGTYYYNKLKVINNPYLLQDATPASVEFAKCIETELGDKLIRPFKNFFGSSQYWDMDLSTDLKDSDLKNMTLYLIKEDRHEPEMGSFAYFLNTFHNSKKRRETSPILKAFSEFIRTLPNPKFIEDESQLLNVLMLITTKYRNGSVHTKPLPFEYVEEFYNLLSGHNRDGFLFRMIKGLCI